MESSLKLNQVGSRPRSSAEADVSSPSPMRMICSPRSTRVRAGSPETCSKRACFLGQPQISRPEVMHASLSRYRQTQKFPKLGTEASRYDAEGFLGTSQRVVVHPTDGDGHDVPRGGLKRLRRETTRSPRVRCGTARCIRDSRGRRKAVGRSAELRRGVSTGSTGSWRLLLVMDLVARVSVRRHENITGGARRPSGPPIRLAELVAELEALPGWVWDPQEHQWETSFDQLDHFVRTHGHTRVPGGHIVDGVNLGTWIGVQRTSAAPGRTSSGHLRLRVLARAHAQRWNGGQRSRTPPARTGDRQPLHGSGLAPAPSPRRCARVDPDSRDVARNVSGGSR